MPQPFMVGAFFFGGYLPAELNLDVLRIQNESGFGEANEVKENTEVIFFYE